MKPDRKLTLLKSTNSEAGSGQGPYSREKLPVTTIKIIKMPNIVFFFSNYSE